MGDNRGQIEQERDKLVALIPSAITAIAECIRKPGRNSQTKLAAAKTILDRAGLPAVATTDINAVMAGSVTITVAETLRAKRAEYLAKEAAQLEPPKAIE